MMSDRFKCPKCGGEFDELTDVTAKTLKIGSGFIKYDAKGCPWCGKAMATTGENPRKTTLFGGNQTDDK